MKQKQKKRRGAGISIMTPRGIESAKRYRERGEQMKQQGRVSK